MAHLEWSDALSLDLPLMDDTHREFVALLALVQSAPDAQLATTWLGVDRRLHDVREVSEDGSGGRLILRDRVTGGEVEVRRLRRTARFTPGTLVWARVVPDGESHQFVGAVVPVAPEDEQAVLRLVRTEHAGAAVVGPTDGATATCGCRCSRHRYVIDRDGHGSPSIVDCGARRRVS